MSHGLIVAMRRLGLSENAIEIARELIRQGLVHWADGYWIIERKGQMPALIPAPGPNKRQVAATSGDTVTEAAPAAVVQSQLDPFPCSSGNWEGNGWPR